jgi:hypothetical protein
MFDEVQVNVWWGTSYCLMRYKLLFDEVQVNVW